MLQIELSPDVETRLQAQVRAQGVKAESYVKKLIENAVCSALIRPRRLGAVRDMDVFFKAMAANSDQISQLPDEAFTRESFYRDHN